MFLLNLPVGVSVVIVLTVSMVFSAGLYFCIYRILGGNISEGTKNTAGMVATRIGVVYALVIGLMFTGVTSEYNKMVLELEMEAAALARCTEHWNDTGTMKNSNTPDSSLLNTSALSSMYNGRLCGNCGWRQKTRK